MESRGQIFSQRYCDLFAFLFLLPSSKGDSFKHVKSHISDIEVIIFTFFWSKISLHGKMTLFQTVILLPSWRQKKPSISCNAILLKKTVSVVFLKGITDIINFTNETAWDNHKESNPNFLSNQLNLKQLPILHIKGHILMNDYLTDKNSQILEWKSLN